VIDSGVDGPFRVVLFGAVQLHPRQGPKPQNPSPTPQSRIFLTVDISWFSQSGEGFCHGAHLDFNDPRPRGLFAGQQNRAGHVRGLQHVRVADPFLRPPPAKGKFGLHASWTDHADLDAVRSQFPVKRLRKTDLANQPSSPL
jgi:hypothetical protein